MIFEFATAMAERGHTVHLFHHDLFGGDAISSIDEVEWYDFRADIDHRFAGSPPIDPALVPDADVFFGYSEQVERHPHFGLPVVWVQGYRMYPGDKEEANFHHPCPKICIARWLVDVAMEHGVPRNELVHVSNAIHHDRYRLLRPIEGRTPTVLFCHNGHPRKGAALGLEVLTEIHARRPEATIRAFASQPPAEPLPDWIELHVDPPQEMLVGELYNSASVFLWTSVVEGFGLPPLEAMACGAALVTTDNGGSRDYAVPGETALVSPSRQARPLVEHTLRLLDDDGERVRLATAGMELARTFTWARAGERLEEFLLRYVADPTAYGRPSSAGADATQSAGS